MRTRFKRPIPKPIWIAGIAVCLLSASGTVAIFASTLASYASIPDDDAPSRRAAAPRGSGDARVSDAQANAAITQAFIAIAPFGSARPFAAGALAALLMAAARRAIVSMRRRG